ncbi:MAG TPA: hypothetical protein VMV49_07450 [Candidatus Deferrimicrobium sp.]|nr:hypothetical protein [Candidatus Deferrimicrobium sp.]
MANQRFEEFLERVIGTSRLELAGGRLANAFLDESQRSELTLKEFLNTFYPFWEIWKKTKGGHMISPFIEEKGPSIFKIWLSLVFPFNYSQLQTDSEKGGSLVDTQGFVEYTYSPAERQLVKKICEKYQIVMPEREVTRILITNAIKSLDPSISKILETNYRLFIDKIDFFEKEENLGIRVGFVGRIG